MAGRIVKLRLNQQQLELLERTRASLGDADIATLVRRALTESADKKEAHDG